MSPRARAAEILADVVAGRKYLDHALVRRLDPAADPRDRALTRELCYGVLRWYFRFDFILAGLMKKPLKAADTDIRMLMMCGLYQLDFLRTPDHAAIAGTVEAAKELKKPWAVALINAVLRRYQREQETLAADIAKSPQAYYAHPQWLIDVLSEQWPEHLETVLESNNRRPPLHLRVNPARISRDDYLSMLAENGIEATAAELTPCGVHILVPMDVQELPGFQAGLVSVQDFGAQLAAGLLDLQSRQRILDACAAPGGKTGHIAELAPEPAELIAVESDPDRMELLEETRRRLGFNAKVLCSDIIQNERWWDGTAFDRILLDAPCSATGVIRRHPDIKLLRSPDQITRLEETQRRILESLWPLLQPGGKLLYVTCSVLKQEGEQQIGEFLQHHPDAESETLALDRAITLEYGCQILPGTCDADGFYYARLLKTA